MKKDVKFSVLLFLLTSFTVFCQVSGNQAYGNQGDNNYYNHSNNNNRQPRKSITANGSEFTVTSLVLINVKADILVVTLGLNQEGKAVKECSENINKRIDGFKQKLKSLGAKDKDVYVDFISQTRIYDYEVKGATAMQYETGFEIKKNVIIRLANTKKLDELISLAAEFEIYDVVKAEYVNEKVDEINANLFSEAIKISNAKKDQYVKAFGLMLSDEFSVAETAIYSVQPKTQYKKYQAFESSDVSNYYNNQYVKKEQRKNRTFYYEGLDTTSFDKVINPDDPEVCLQYVVEMKVVYHIKK
jgi:uncharacterized protein YggE